MALTRVLENQVSINMESVVICHMMEIQIKDIFLFQYGVLVMKILKHIGFDIEEE